MLLRVLLKIIDKWVRTPNDLGEFLAANRPLLSGLDEHEKPIVWQAMKEGALR